VTAPVTTLLTVRQRRVLEAIRSHYTTHGYAPSMREIGEQVGLGAVSSVRHQLEVLERMGWIRRQAGLPRALVVLNPADGGE
jgi:repressor LexA